MLTHTYPSPMSCRACSLEPGNPTFWRSLGQHLRNCGRHAEAVAALNRLLQLAADDEAGLQARG